MLLLKQCLEEGKCENCPQLAECETVWYAFWLNIMGEKYADK